MATGDTPLQVYDGDIIQLYCPLEAGYVYSELNSTSELEVNIVSKDRIKADFAAFTITLEKGSTNEDHSKVKRSTTAVTEKIAYGSIVSLKHQVFDKFLTAKDEEVKFDATKALFRVVSPNHELEWGEELKDDYLIKLELSSNSLIHFHYDHQRKFYKPTLKASGTVFNVKVYCHECLKQNPKSIKGDSPITISTLLNIGYLCAAGSFVSSKVDEITSTRALGQQSPGIEQTEEQPSASYGCSGQQSGVNQPKEQPHKEEIKVGLIKFKEGLVKKLPNGDSFFQLERISGPPGSPILFGEECRIKHLFTLKYISVTPEEKAILCDLNESNLKLRILPISGSTDQKEICDFDRIVFQNVESSLYLSVNLRIFQQENELFNLTLNEDSSVLQSQFKVLQVEKSLLEDYYLDDVMKGQSKRSPQGNGMESDQDEVDSGESTLAINLDLHIEKLLYEKSLVHPDTEEWVPLATLVELLKRMRDSEELLTKYGISKDDIKSCLESYNEPPSTVKYAPTSDGEVVINIGSTGRSASSALPTLNLQSVATRPIGDDDNAKVSQLLLMLHLLFTKYVFTSVRSQSSAIEPTEKKNFKIFFENNCDNWCRILSRLIIANESYTINYMSVSLLFDIYMREEIIGKKIANYKENINPIKREKLELIKKMLRMQLKEDKDNLTKFLTECYSQDISEPNVSANDLYTSGLFYIILEYTLKHSTYPIFYEEEVIFCCFKLLLGLAASSKKVQNEMFCYFFNFLQFKRVTNVMICLINEIFYRNSYLCKKLTKSDLGKIFNTAIMSGTTGHYQWTIVLQTIIENSDQVQAKEHIAQLISKHSNDYLQHILCPRDKPKKATYWLEILPCSIEEHKDECHLLLNITDLLASCASGECQYGRLVATKFFNFDDLMEILMSEAVPIYSKLPFIRILTVTYLIDGGHFTANCSEYKKLWPHINNTIKKFTPNSGDIKSKFHWVIYQQIVKVGKYMQPVEDITEQPVEDMMELLYITDGVIPFLSELCQQMSHLSSKEDICSTEDLQSVGEKLMELKNYCSVSEKLESSKCIEKINLLLINQIDPPVRPSSNTDSTNTGEVRLVESYIMSNKFHLSSESIEPPSNCHEKMIELLKGSNDGNVRTVLDKVILTLKNLVILQKNDKLSCFERIDVEQTISKVLVLLQTVIKKVIPPASKESLDEKELEVLIEIVKKVLYFNDCSNKEHTIFCLLQSQNNEIIFQVVAVLKCFEKAPKIVQEMMILSCETHDNVYVVQVHRLLREAEAHIEYNGSQNWNYLATPDKLSYTERGIAAALDVIILLCDRQQRDMQDAMRIKDSNIVNQVSLIFFYISKHWDDNKVNIAQKTVQTLIEMCTGNYSNQDIAYKGQVIVSINAILKTLSSKDKNKEKRELKCRLKSSCLKLLEVMLEEIDENSCDLANRIASQLDMESLIREIKESRESEKSTSLAMRAYHVLRRIADYKCVSVEELVKAKEDEKKMWKHYQEQSKSVQIVYKEYDKPEILTRVYFHNDPNIHIDLDLKDKIIRKIERFTPQEKLLNLLEWAKAVKEDNSEEKNKLKKYKVAHRLSLKTEKLRDILLTILTLVLNLLILFTVTTPPDYNMPNGVCTANESYNETCNNSTSSSPMYFQPIWYPDIPVWSTVILTILGIIHVVLAVIMVIEYFTKKWGYITNLKDLKRQISSFLGIYQHNKRSRQMPLQSKKLISASILSYQSLYRIFFLICSALALIPYPTTLKYFYCGCMLYPFMNSLAMKYILRAIHRSIIQLFTILLLCLVITYIYAVISFALLNNYFSKERDQFCGSIFECFVTVSHLGLLGSSLDIRPSNDYKPSFGLYFGRVVYDLVLYIVIIVLGLNIVLAILVADRFSDAKSHWDNVEKDEERNCFICSIPRTEFQKKEKDFLKHVKEEHSIWDYIRFIIHVKDHPENEHNALEKYVYEQVKDEGNESIDFFPLYRAKSLPEYEHHESKTEKLLRRTQEAEFTCQKCGSLSNRGHKRRITS